MPKKQADRLAQTAAVLILSGYVVLLFVNLRAGLSMRIVGGLMLLPKYVASGRKEMAITEASYLLIEALALAFLTG